MLAGVDCTDVANLTSTQLILNNGLSILAELDQLLVLAVQRSSLIQAFYARPRKRSQQLSINVADETAVSLTEPSSKVGKQLREGSDICGQMLDGLPVDTSGFRLAAKKTPLMIGLSGMTLNRFVSVFHKNWHHKSGFSQGQACRSTATHQSPERNPAAGSDASMELSSCLPRIHQPRQVSHHRTLGRQAEPRLASIRVAGLSGLGSELS